MHTIWLETKLIVGVGLTMIENVLAIPLHVLDTGVTVIKEEMGRLEELVVVKAPIFPVPAVGKPIKLLLLVHW